MSGHSKWHTIKHKKGAADAKRGKIFTRIIKELTVAARSGGGDPASNPRLRTVVAEAKANNMPRENIERAIRRGTGEEPGVSYEEITYEGYGPGGVALMIQAVTDNKNRTVGEIRHLLSKHGGNLGEAGCVAWMFEKRGYLLVEKSRTDEDTLMTVALDAGAHSDLAFLIGVLRCVVQQVRKHLCQPRGVGVHDTRLVRQCDGQLLIAAVDRRAAQPVQRHDRVGGSGLMRGRAPGGGRRESVPGLVGPPPPPALVEQTAERVDEAVEIGRDVQAPHLGVVAGVADETRQPELAGRRVHEGPEPHALHEAPDDDPVPRVRGHHALRAVDCPTSLTTGASAPRAPPTRSLRSVRARIAVQDSTRRASPSRPSFVPT